MTRDEIAALAQGALTLAEIFEQRSNEFLSTKSSKSWYAAEAERLRNAARSARRDLNAGDASRPNPTSR